MPEKHLPSTVKTDSNLYILSEENYVPKTHQLVQEMECRQGSFLQSL